MVRTVLYVWGSVAEDTMYDLQIGAIFYSRLLKNFAVKIISKEEQGWKSIRKWAVHALQTVYRRLGNEGLIAILPQPLSSSPMIAILRVTTTVRILATTVKCFEENIRC